MHYQTHCVENTFNKLKYFYIMVKKNKQITIQIISKIDYYPCKKDMIKWIKLVLYNKNIYHICLRIVSILEMQKLHRKFLYKNFPTNVLSFPIAKTSISEMPFLGDIVLCSKIINQEAMNQNKIINSHWAHMIIHGILHLLGYTHKDKKKFIIMKNQEIFFLKKLNIKNPYLV